MTRCRCGRLERRCDFPYCPTGDEAYAEAEDAPEGERPTDQSIHEALCVEDGCMRCAR